jgi:hypothetical protein
MDVREPIDYAMAIRPQRGCGNLACLSANPQPASTTFDDATAHGYTHRAPPGGEAGPGGGGAVGAVQSKIFRLRRRVRNRGSTMRGQALIRPPTPNQDQTSRDQPHRPIAGRTNPAQKLPASDEHQGAPQVHKGQI